MSRPILLDNGPLLVGAPEDAPDSGATYVYKTADETLNNDATPQDDDHLFFTAEANGIYAFEAFLFAIASAVEPAIEWVEPDGTFIMSVFSTDTGAGATQNFTLDESTGSQDVADFAGNFVTNSLAIRITGTILAGGTGGTFKLQWAQRIADASDTTLKKGSWIKYQKIN